MSEGFRAWYEKRYRTYPGVEGEMYADVFNRLADAFAEYVDEVANADKKEPRDDR